MIDTQARAWTPAPLPEGAAPPKGPYTPAVRAGGFVFVSGQTPRDAATGALIGATVQAQTRQTLENVRQVLAAAGAGLNAVVAVTVYLSDVTSWDAFNVVYREFFQEPFPTRTVIGADLRDILVEVSAVAYTGAG